jgi:hypothetical protein
MSPQRRRVGAGGGNRRKARCLRAWLWASPVETNVVTLLNTRSSGPRSILRRLVRCSSTSSRDSTVYASVLALTWRSQKDTTSIAGQTNCVRSYAAIAGFARFGGASVYSLAAKPRYRRSGSGGEAFDVLDQSESAFLTASVLDTVNHLGGAGNRDSH